MSRRLALGIGLAGAAVALVLLLRSPGGEGTPEAPVRTAPVASAPRTGAASRSVVPEVPDANETVVRDGVLQSGPSDPDTGAEADFESALRWSLVDLDVVREALPDNMYWEMSAPTDDPDVVARREQERARWNREYGKVLSGTASEQEIDDYYALRRRISEDAVEFSAYLTTHYGDVLPERDLGLLQLASRLHRARLEEMPRKLAEALERKHQQDRLREAWRADQAAFEPAHSEIDD